MDKREWLKVSPVAGTEAVPLPQLDGLKEEGAGGRGFVRRTQDAEQWDVYKEGCSLGGEKGAVTREPREPRLRMDSPTPPKPSPTSPGFIPPCCCCWESHRSSGCSGSSPSFIFYQASPFCTAPSKKPSQVSV